MIIFDMEWNSGLYDGIRLDEILQIGAVKCARPGGQVEDSFCVFIRPRVHRRYSPGAADLPDLDQAKASPLDFPTAARMFLDWCGSDRVFATWGGNDFTALLQNFKYWKLELKLPDTYVDLQAAFDCSVGARSSVSLERAVEYCRVPDIYDPHNALSDAIYTWAVCAHLTDRQIDLARRDPAAVGLRHPTSVLPRRKTPWKGPFDEVAGMLNNRGIRRAVCPVCRATVSVRRWFYTKKGPYFASVPCPRDGEFLWRVETARDKRGRLWGNPAPLPWSPQSRSAFGQAKAANTLECRGRKRKRRHANRSHPGPDQCDPAAKAKNEPPT